ncbi:hypothetical protein HT136_04325 [Novosphingobium profundi]|nr:hypothetical protein [Novosphingobium profundi]
MHRSHLPAQKRKARAGIFVVAILTAIVVVIFVGRNIWHAEVQHEDHMQHPAAASASPSGTGNGPV